MNNKYSVAISFLSLCSVISLTAFGVICSSETNTRATNGEIYYYSDETIFLDVKGSIQDENGTDYSSRDFQYSAPVSKENVFINALETWKMGTISLSKTNSYVIYTLQVTNTTHTEVIGTYTKDLEVNCDVAIHTIAGDEPIKDYVNSAFIIFSPRETKIITVKYYLTTIPQENIQEDVSFMLSVSL